jgi:hypothetical protein
VLLLWLAGCSSSATSLQVSIELRPGVVARQLDLRVEVAELGISVEKPLPAALLPGAVSIRLPDQSADVQVTLTGTDALGASLSATRTVRSQPGREVALTFVLGDPQAPGDMAGGADAGADDGAMPADLAGADLAGADLTGPVDLRMPDMTTAAGDMTMGPPITFRSGIGSDHSNSQSHSMTRPSPVMAGDILIAGISLGYTGSTNANLTPPAGWTFIRRVDQTEAMGLYFFWKLATASEPATYTWMSDQSVHGPSFMVAYYNVHPTSPVVIDQGADRDVSQKTYVAPSITPGIGNTVVLVTFTGHSDSGTGTWSTPASTTARVQKDDSYTRTILVTEYRPTSGGATPAFSSTQTLTQSFALVHALALRPAP